jgi:hypothetical protein
MKYCRRTTESLPLSIQFRKWLQKMTIIISNNIKAQNLYRINNNFVFVDEVALNLDEIKNNSGNKDIEKYKSVDMVLGMKDEHGDKRLLLVELKLNCNGIKSLSQECKGKIEDSKVLLFGGGIPIHNKYVFIFNNTLLLSQARSVISRQLTNPYAEVLSIDELKSNYF